MKRYYLSFLTLAFALTFSSCSDDDKNDNKPIDEPQYNGTAITFNNDAVMLLDGVKNVGVFTKDDVVEDEALEAIAGITDFWEDLQGGCSAASKKLASGDLVFGRNMDLTLSDTRAHVFMTTFGNYKTVNLQYFPSFDADVNPDMVCEEYYPYVSTDVMNEEGLYMQTNMRNVEGDKYACSGTNPGKKRIFMPCLGQYVCSRCATVDEAVALIQDLDVYSGCNPDEQMQAINWAFAWNIGDANGNRALVEIAKNKVYVTRDNDIHTNFFIDPELNKEEEFGSGYGRYDFLAKGLPSVKSEIDMHKLLTGVYFWNIYATCAKDSKNTPFDMRSEWVASIRVNDKGEYDEEKGELANCTYSWVMDPKNADLVYKVMNEQSKQLVNTPEEVLRENMTCWKSVFHVVANCTQKKMTFSFFENDDPKYTYTYKFE